MDGGDSMTINGNQLIASDGKALQKGDAVAKIVYLGVNDVAENWVEIDELQTDEATPEQLEAALHQIGGAVDENQ
jgi:hypothetical protein